MIYFKMQNLGNWNSLMSWHFLQNYIFFRRKYNTFSQYPHKNIYVVVKAILLNVFFYAKKCVTWIMGFEKGSYNLILIRNATANDNRFCLEMKHNFSYENCIHFGLRYVGIAIKYILYYLYVFCKCNLIYFYFDGNHIYFIKTCLNYRYKIQFSYFCFIYDIFLVAWYLPKIFITKM